MRWAIGVAIGIGLQVLTFVRATVLNGQFYMIMRSQAEPGKLKFYRYSEYPCESTPSGWSTLSTPSRPADHSPAEYPMRPQRQPTLHCAHARRRAAELMGGSRSMRDHGDHTVVVSCTAGGRRRRAARWAT
jgi:hypothetical protein